MIDTYPKKGTKLISNDRVILYTNGNEILLPSLLDFSYKEVNYFCSSLKINCGISGNGFVSKQSVEEGTNINDIASLELMLENKNLNKNNDTLKEV